MPTGNALVDELIDAGWTYEQTCVKLATALERPVRVLASMRVQARVSEYQVQLDRICEETAARLGVPTALVTLIDDAAIEFIGAYGMPHQRAPIDKSVCQFAVASDEPIEIGDAMTMMAVPVIGENASDADVRAYFGAPWHASNQPIGTVCAFGPEPREWTDEEKAFIEKQAARVTEIVALLG